MVAEGDGAKLRGVMESILQPFHARGVRYLLIGGQALQLSGAPRASLGWDFFIPPDDSENLDKINDLLGSIVREPVLPLGEHGENRVQVFEASDWLLQFHLTVPGMDSFHVAELAGVERRTALGTPVRCASPRHLLSAKLAADRSEDQADIQFLMEIVKQSVSS